MTSEKFALAYAANPPSSTQLRPLFSYCFFSVIFLIQGIAYSQTFEPAQESFIKDNRPKPNVMFVLDTSSIGLDNKITLSDEEREYFKQYLSGQSSISKTEAVAIAYQKLLDEYWTVAHFALGKVIDKSAYTYTMYPEYKNKEALDESEISTIIVPFLNQGIAYAGNYSVISKEEYQQNQKIRNELKQFHTKHSTPYEPRRAWVYSLTELYKYSSGLPIVKSIAEETNDEEGKGLKRITFSKPQENDEGYADPMKFICQNSYILYSPVDISRDFAETHNGISQDFDASVGVDEDVIYGMTTETVPDGKGGYTGVYRYYKLSDLYQEGLDKTVIDSMTASYRKRLTNLFSSAINALDNTSMLAGSAMMQHVHPSKAKDLYGNNWSGFNGTAYWKTPRYSSSSLTAAQTYISGVYFGDPIIHEKKSTGYTVIGSYRNELQALMADLSYQKDYDQKDYLINFLQPIFTYHYSGTSSRYEGNGGLLTAANVTSHYSNVTTNRVAQQSYTRSDANNEPTLMGVYLRHKEYLDDIVLKPKNNGRFFTDQHIRDPYDAQIDTTFEVTHNEQLWTSNIKAKRLSVPDQKGECQVNQNNQSYTGAFEDNVGWWVAPDVEPTWETSKAITEDQGDFFTSINGRKVGIFTLIEEINQVSWLKGKLDLDPSIYRVRNNRLGDIVNSSIRYVAKDHFYTNLALVGNRNKYIEYMFLKHENLHQNLVIAGSNDGFINFIVAGRNHKDQPLQRRASYFVPFFADDINEITKPLYIANKQGDYVKGFTHRYRVDGKINHL